MAMRSDNDNTTQNPTNAPQQNASISEDSCTEQELIKAEREMTGFEKATLRWSKIAVIMATVAAAFISAQWWEMHEGGKDTHNLASDTHTLALAAKEQADAVKERADSEAKDAEVSRQITIRQSAAHIIPNFNETRHGINIFFTNTGKVPALNLEAQFVIDRETFPERQRVGQSYTRRVSEGQVVSGTSNPYYLPDWPEQPGVDIRDMKWATDVRGSYSFDDGYGHKIKEEFCLTHAIVQPSPNSQGMNSTEDCEQANNEYRITHQPKQ